MIRIREAVERVAPIAFRTADEIADYVDKACQIEPNWRQAFDEAILQKVLPRIRGFQPEVHEALERLKTVCDGHFPLSATKIDQMLTQFQHGSASYF